jgi:hypothetical protein
MKLQPSTPPPPTHTHTHTHTHTQCARTSSVQWACSLERRATSRRSRVAVERATAVCSESVLSSAASSELDCICFDASSFSVNARARKRSYSFSLMARTCQRSVNNGAHLTTLRPEVSPHLQAMVQCSLIALQNLLPPRHVSSACSSESRLLVECRFEC